MGLTDFFSDLMANVGFQEAYAEAPAKEEENQDGGDEGGEEEKSEGGEEEESGGDEVGEDEDGAEEEEEEEEEEPEDPKPKIEAGQFTYLLSTPASYHFQVHSLSYNPSQKVKEG